MRLKYGIDDTARNTVSTRLRPVIPTAMPNHQTTVPDASQTGIAPAVFPEPQ
jgi:hypothetical protein